MADPVKSLVSLPLGVTESALDAVESTAKALNPKIPAAPEDPKIAPKLNDEASKRAKARAYQRRFGRAGRAGTVLTGDSKLG